MKDDNKAIHAKELGKRIASRRIEAEMTQEEIAERLGVGIEAISRMERGKAIPNALRLLDIAEIFSCRVDELLQSASHRSQDQAAHLQQLLDQLDETDRKFILDMLESYVRHLQDRQAGR